MYFVRVVQLRLRRRQAESQQRVSAVQQLMVQQVLLLRLTQRQISLLRMRYSRHLFSRSLIRHLLHHLLVARMARMLRHFSERMVLRKPLLTRQQQSERSYHSVDSRSFQAM